MKAPESRITARLLRGWAEKFDSNGALHDDLLDTADLVESITLLNQALADRTAERDRLLEDRHYLLKDIASANEQLADMTERWGTVVDDSVAERDRLLERIETQKGIVLMHVENERRLHAALKLAVSLLRQSFADESVFDTWWAKSNEAKPLREALHD